MFKSERGHSKINVPASKCSKTAKKTRKNGWKQPKTAKILLENGYQGVYVAENGSSQLKKDNKLLKVARYVWKDIKKMIKRIKKGKNERK